ncbi:MAG: RNA polymerase sigma factor [Solirubrobacteraceae bacterium]
MSEQHELNPERLGDHIDRLYRAAWGLCGSREDAEDLVQETFVRVLGRPRLLHSQDELGYLLRVLRNTYISDLRYAARRPRRADLDVDQLMAVDERSPDPEAKLMVGALYGAISSLPAAFRDAVVAVDLVGLSYREAARALRVREATLTTRLYRGRKRLVELLADQ